MELTLEKLLADNRAAVGLLTTAVDAIPKRAWNVPFAEGKWSAAQHVHHVALAYVAMVRDVTGRGSTTLIGTAWKRRLWKLVGLTQILRRGRLPRGVTSPREFRPPDTSPVRAALLAELRERVKEFETSTTEAWTVRPSHRVVHPYFGPITLRQAIIVVAVHTRHHAMAIRAAPTATF